MVGLFTLRDVLEATEIDAASELDRQTERYVVADVDALVVAADAVAASIIRH